MHTHAPSLLLLVRPAADLCVPLLLERYLLRTLQFCRIHRLRGDRGWRRASSARAAHLMYTLRLMHIETTGTFTLF